MAKLRKKIKIGNGCMTAILIALLFVVIYAVSWICTCGIIKLIINVLWSDIFMGDCNRNLVGHSVIERHF